MTDHQPQSTDVGPRCVCGHPEHVGRYRCGCRTYVSAGFHPDQARGGPFPAAVALLLGAGLLVVVVTVILLQLW
ncbi:MAG TPA: hypothetical protein VHH34_07650 [Pseudonocardiaceae bacterium]|nr:hypothetical protein [Pseudonocardiaceae bacterium]